MIKYNDEDVTKIFSFNKIPMFNKNNRLFIKNEVLIRNIRKRKLMPKNRRTFFVYYEFLARNFLRELY